MLRPKSFSVIAVVTDMLIYSLYPCFIHSQECVLDLHQNTSVGEGCLYFLLCKKLKGTINRFESILLCCRFWFGMWCLLFFLQVESEHNDPKCRICKGLYCGRGPYFSVWYCPGDKMAGALSIFFTQTFFFSKSYISRLGKI